MYDQKTEFELNLELVVCERYHNMVPKVIHATKRVNMHGVEKYEHGCCTV